MDPNATLDEINEEVSDLYFVDEERASRLFELLDNLGSWLRRGGALPDEWRNES
jgi:hypothetical protein